MDKSVDIFRTQYFNLCRILLTLTGQWPYQNRTVAIALRTLICTHLMILLNAQICKIVKYKNNTRMLIETIPYILSTLVAVLRYLNNLMNIKRMKNLLDRVKYDWECAVLNNECHIFESCARGARKIFMTYTLFLNSLMFMYLLIQIMLEVLKKLTSWNFTSFTRQSIQVEFFVDEEKYFQYILFFADMTICLGYATFIAIDLEMQIVINHACTMFTIVGYRLENAFSINLEKRSRNEKVNEKLIRIAKYHTETLQFVDRVSSYCSGLTCLLFFIMIVTFSIMSVHAYITLKAFDNLMIFFFPLMTFCGELIMAIYNTILMQSIVDASSSVFHQAYSGEWYTASASDQKILLLIMRKSMEPAAIIFANVFTLSLERFAKAAETTISYFMLLYSFQ